MLLPIVTMALQVAPRGMACGTLPNGWNAMVGGNYHTVNAQRARSKGLGDMNIVDGPGVCGLSHV